MRTLLLTFLLAVPAAAQQAEKKPAAAKTKSVASEAIDQAKGIGGSLRRLALQIGSGVDTGNEVLDPYLPKGDERRYKWDAHLMVRNSGIALQTKNTQIAGWRQVALDWRLKFDPFNSAGVGHARDEVLDTFKQTPPVPKFGWGLGLAGVRDEYWGWSVDFDKTKERDSPDWGVTRTVSLGNGYSPLGANAGKPWNMALISSVYWTDVKAFTSGLESSKAGPGFSVGPAYQLALDAKTRPFFERLDIDHIVKMDQLKTSVIYNGPSIGVAAWKLTTDVRMFVTKNVRLTLGFEETYFMAGTTKFKFRTGLTFFIHFIKVSL